MYQVKAALEDIKGDLARAYGVLTTNRLRFVCFCAGHTEANLDVQYIMGVAPGVLTEFWCGHSLQERSAFGLKSEPLRLQLQTLQGRTAFGLGFNLQTSQCETTRAGAALPMPLGLVSFTRARVCSLQPLRLQLRLPQSERGARLRGSHTAARPAPAIPRFTTPVTSCLFARLRPSSPPVTSCLFARLRPRDGSRYLRGGDFCADLKDWTSRILSSDSPPLVHSVSYGSPPDTNRVLQTDRVTCSVDHHFWCSTKTTCFGQ